MTDDQPGSESPQLSEQEVWDRLASIPVKQGSDIIDELYTFGLRLVADAAEQIKAVEQKAITFAAYGGAILSVLITTASMWSKVGTSSSFVIASFAGFAGLLCAWFAVRSLRLVTFDTVSERDWLSKEHIGTVGAIKRFHTYALSQVLKSRVKAQAEKAADVESAEYWLIAAACYLMLLLLQIAVANLHPEWFVRALYLLGRESWATAGRARPIAAAGAFILCSLLACLGRIWRRHND